MFDRKIQAGDVISTLASDRLASIRVCQHSGSRYVLVQLDCMINGPTHNQPHIITLPQCRYGLKCYLNDQSFKGPIRKIRITKRFEKSAWCDVVE